ncbi:MAG: GNAT family N-acetyltransferase [Bacteroidetes bacterium]|nr:GNAT family N-acetyltransferase [Bacteroidota bacterium]
MCATVSTSSRAAVAAPSSLRYSYFRSIDAAGRDWDLAAPAHDIFLQRPYLSILESNPPEGMRFGYLVFYGNDEPIGVAICQIKYFKGDDNINDLQVSAKEPCFFHGLAQWFKRWVAGKTAADILICGNMLLTGEHGFYFHEDKIGQTAFTELLEKALDEVIDIMGREGVKMPVILVKDIAQHHKEQGETLTQKGFFEFCIQPNMVMELPFADFDAYLAAMSTKYRTRAKRAIKKLEGVEKREMTLVDIQRELPRIYALYKEVAKNAGFNMVDLNEYYLLALKRDLGHAFRMHGYYQGETLLAFYTTIVNGHELEAHFLGYDKHLNHDLQLYLNCLYDIVRIAFESSCTEIVFARTALEIKSSVGAVAHDLLCYVRHQNSLVNNFTGTILEYLKPVEEWVPRHPFRE